MKRSIVLGLVVVVAIGLVVSDTAFAQEKKVRPSLKASVSQTLGLESIPDIVHVVFLDPVIHLENRIVVGNSIAFHFPASFRIFTSSHGLSGQYVTPDSDHYLP